MGSLQNMLNVYFHMKNHYRKLKTVQSRVDTNQTPKSAGRPKKQRPKMKQTPSAMKEVKDRPPTRRNPNDIIATDKTRNTPFSKAKRSPLGKYKTTSLGLHTPREPSMINVEQHEYLQFSLHITEEIIMNDLIKKEEMIQVLKQHYQANKSRLNQEKLLKTIAELCSELNILMDDNMLQFLEDRGSYSLVGMDAQTGSCTPPESPFSFDLNSGHNNSATGLSSSPRDLKHNLQNSADQQKEVKSLFSAQPYSAMANSANTDSTFHTLDLQPIESTDRTSKEQPDITNEDTIRSGKSNLGTNKSDANGDKIIEVLQSPKEMEDLSKAFEFGEETLKAPGEESMINLHLMEMKVKDIKEFRVLHDATATFIRESDKESDASLARHVSPASTAESSLSKVVHGDHPVFVMNFNAPAKKQDRNMVIAHYSTSVEPEQVQTHEFSVQATLDSSQTVNFESSAPNIIAAPDGNYLNDASTQKSISVSSGTSDDTSTPCLPMHVEGIKSGDQDVKVNSDQESKCKRCNCHRDNIARHNKEENDAGSTCMISTEAQYVLLDCPVLIPREHTKNMDFLNSIASRGGNSEKSFHTLNMPMPPSGYPPNGSMSNMGSGSLVSNYPMEKNDLHNSDYYDLTPQKDMYPQSRVCASSLTHQTINQNPPKPFGCCSCMSANMAPNKLMSDRYDRMDPYTRAQKADRLDRYKKVNENLSYFYPTTATQVSSMDLLSSDMNLYQAQTRYANPLHREYKPSSPPIQYNLHNPNTYHNQYQPYVPLNNNQDQRAKVDHYKTDYSNVSNDSASSEDVVPGTVPNYHTFPKSSPTMANKRERGQINLDNYRIDSSKNAVVEFSSHVGQKRPYGEDVTADRDRSPGQSRGKSPSKSPQRTPHFVKGGQQESEEEVSFDRALQTYHSNDSMEKRIMSLRHDIEKYSKDDLCSKRTGCETPRRGGDILDILQQNSLNGVVLPSEVALPRQKKMSILRKQHKDKQ